MEFQKQHMAGQEYSWHANKIYTGEPTRRLFDRFDGNQVLFIINYYGANVASDSELSIEKAREIEEKILDRLPLDTKSEISVFNWIAGVMKKQPA